MTELGSCICRAGWCRPRSGRRQILPSAVDLTSWYVVALGIELEMVDGRFHRALHFAARRWNDLIILDSHWSLAFGKAQLSLFHDAHRLAHLLHAYEIAVVAIAVLANRNIEVELGIAFVGLRLAQIPGGAGAPHHYA